MELMGVEWGDWGMGQKFGRNARFTASLQKSETRRNRNPTLGAVPVCNYLVIWARGPHKLALQCQELQYGGFAAELFT